MEFASFNVNCSIPIASVSSCFPLCCERHRLIHIFGKSQLVVKTVVFDLKRVYGITVKVTGTLSQVYPNSQSLICQQAWNDFSAKKQIQLVML